MKRRVYFLLLLLLSGCSDISSLPTVEEFDLARYLGKWYEIARLPNRFEKGMTQVTAEYTLKPDGSISVINSGIKAGKRQSIRGTAKATDTPGELRVSFFRPFYGSYRIAALAPDYSSALVVSGNSRKLLWILSRTPTLAPEILDFYLELAEKHGFDTSKIIISQ